MQTEVREPGKDTRMPPPDLLERPHAHPNKHFHLWAANDAKMSATRSPGGPPPSFGQQIVYTCPMHPQVRQASPGNCPICGMTLEPLDATAVTAPSPELADLTRRFWIGLVLTLPVLIIEMAGHLPLLGRLHFLSPAISNWVQFALVSPCRPLGRVAVLSAWLAVRCEP